MKFKAELVGRVIGHLKENLNPVDVLKDLTPDQFIIIKATWVIGSGIRESNEWQQATQYEIPVKGNRTDAEYIAEHDVLCRLQIGLGKLLQTDT